jgi:predicted cation transporter
MHSNRHFLIRTRERTYINFSTPCIYLLIRSSNPFVPVPLRGEYNMDPILVHAGLFIVLIGVLIGPFRLPIIERNLEVFLFACGVIALSLAGFLSIPGEVTGWREGIVEEALSAPLAALHIFGIPLGIVQIVLIVGLIIHFWHEPLHRFISRGLLVFSLPVLAFLLIVVLGLVSSVISAIIASIILVEMICALPFSGNQRVNITVIACFAIGIGAALTPLGEPLSTITVTKLAGSPYYAGFDFLIRLFGIPIVLGILGYGVLGAVIVKRLHDPGREPSCTVSRETLREVFVRALKVYLFIMALVFLGEGFKPLILAYITQIPSAGLYWINMLSAVLDNATLTAAEIGPVLTMPQIRNALLGLLIAGGMLIPGNIPNIIAAGKLRITSREWARVGIPIGVVSLLIFFMVLLLPVFG